MSYCFFCHGRKDGIDEITNNEMCEEHLKELDAMMLDFMGTHPDGKCTNDCGCITLEELNERFSR